MNIKKAMKIAMAQRGMNQRQLATASGLTEATLSRISSGKPPSIGTIIKIAAATSYSVDDFIRLTGEFDADYNELPPERSIDMCCRYKKGQTLQEIGDVYGLTRERVRQLIKEQGVDWTDGGQHVRSINRKKKKIKAVNAKCINRYGCDLDTYKELISNGLTRMYIMQRRNAMTRDIEWKFNLWTWFVVWRDSGKLNQRGRKRGQYVMSRYGDTGAYSPSNVQIITCSENIIQVRTREARAKARGEIT